MPKVTKIDNNTFDVVVTEAMETTHRVTLDDEYYRELTAGNITKEKLIEESFQFLLERESNTSILKKFPLQTIEQYFPEYHGEMRNRFE